LKGRFHKDEHVVLHCRGAKMTSVALHAVEGFPNARIIYDARGDEVAETYDTFGLDGQSDPHPTPSQRKSIETIREYERRAVTLAHGVTAVSQSLLNTLQSRHGVDLPGRSLVIPCCPDIEAFTPWLPKRDEARRALGLSNKFIVCYLGSLAWYQMPELSLRVFRLIRQLRDDAHFLAITTQPERMAQIVRENGISETDFTIRSFPPSEVPRWLVAADLGLLLRKQDAVNRAASPVKFGEYLAAGVPVVISQRVGDASDLVQQFKLGCVIDIDATDSEILEQLERGISAAPIQGSRIASAESHLHWRKITSQRFSFYKAMCQNRDLRKRELSN
jgi:glycosyltransferase involved in cell wall biosynthesis